MIFVALFAVCIALLVAHISPPRERRYVWPCAVALAVNWLLYIAAWLPQNLEPAWVIYNSTGLALKTDTVWSFADFITAVWVISIAYERFWGIALHTLYLTQIVVQIMSDANGWGNNLDHALTGIFYLQIACLLAGGWDGVEDRIAGLGDVWRRAFLCRDLPCAKVHSEAERVA